MSASPGETRLIAAEFARHLSTGTVLSLTGDLGAGKTEFVKGLALGLGTNDEVTSPTFTLVHEYRGVGWHYFIWTSIVSMRKANWTNWGLKTISQPAAYRRVGVSW